MRLQYESFEQDDPNYSCPVCGHQLVPPEYPHCGHLAFLHLDCAAGDAGFDHTDRDFAVRYLEVLKKAVADSDYDEVESLSDTDCEKWLSGDLCPLHDQGIPFDPDLVDESVFPDDALIVTISETDRNYPTTITLAIRRS